MGRHRARLPPTSGRSKVDRQVAGALPGTRARLTAATSDKTATVAPSSPVQPEAGVSVPYKLRLPHRGRPVPDTRAVRAVE